MWHYWLSFVVAGPSRPSAHALEDSESEEEEEAPRRKRLPPTPKKQAGMTAVHEHFRIMRSVFIWDLNCCWCMSLPSFLPCHSQRDRGKLQASHLLISSFTKRPWPVPGSCLLFLSLRKRLCPGPGSCFFLWYWNLIEALTASAMLVCWFLSR